MSGAAGRARRSGWALGLGAASVGLGLAPVLAPSRVLRFIGVDDSQEARRTLKAIGVRELAAAAALLAVPRRQAIWGRVAGDAVDLALLGRALGGPADSRRGRIAAATGAVAAITAIDIAGAVIGDRGAPGTGASAAITINRPRAEVFAFWRQLENLPSFMAHLEEVKSIDGRRSRWRAHAPMGRIVEWEAEVVDEVPGERLCWRSTGEAAVPNEGEVVFADAPGDRGTELRVTIRYDLAGAARAAARYLGEEPRQQLDDDLRRLKQVLETGEVVRSDGAPWGKTARREFPQRPAQPMSPSELAEVLAP